MNKPQRFTERKSLKDKLASGFPVGADALTETTVTTIRGLENLNTTFRIDRGGGVAKDASVASLAAPMVHTSGGTPIRAEQSEHHHLLLLSSSVSPDELEALAVSVWDEAGWVGAGRLRLCASVTLEGPWTIDGAGRSLLKCPKIYTQAWVLVCPAMRGQAPSEKLSKSDSWARAFPKGMPVSLEWKVLVVLQRMARRLAGAIHIGDTGRIITPDPDSAVNLEIFSPTWLESNQCESLLRPILPGIVDSRQVRAEQPSGMPSWNRNRTAEIPAQFSSIPPEIREAIAADMRQTPVVNQEKAPYALIVDAGKQSQIMVEVSRITSPPRVLRWETWTSGPIVEYRLRWIPPIYQSLPILGLPRKLRLERLACASQIELAASTIIKAVGGSIVDEDGFLVAFDDA